MVVHQFLGGDDSANPRNTLIQASDGAFYGVTLFGDTAVRGTIFKISNDGSVYSIVYIFTGLASGQQPNCRLLEGSDAALYGTCPIGGSALRGVLFKVNKDGTGYNIIYNFRRSGGEGYEPASGVIEASDGLLYGTTYSGGSEGAGTVYKIDKNGNGFSVVSSFTTNTISGLGFTKPQHGIDREHGRGALRRGLQQCYLQAQQGRLRVWHAKEPYCKRWI